MRLIIAACLFAISFAQTVGELAFEKVLAHQANGHKPMHELLNLPVLKELSQTKEAQRARRALEELKEIDIGDGSLGQWLTEKASELLKDGNDVILAVKDAAAEKIKAGEKLIQGILDDAETKKQMSELVAKMKAYMEEQIKQLATNIKDALTALGKVLETRKAELAAPAKLLKEITDGTKKMEDVKKEMGDLISQKVMGTIATVQSAIGLVDLDPPIRVYGFGTSGDVMFGGGAGWSLNGFMQSEKFDGAEHKNPFAITAGFNIGAGAVASASVGVPITFSWNQEITDQRGFGLGVDFGVNVLGGFQISLGWTWDTKTSKLKFATISVAAATGLGGGVKVYGTYTQILAETTLLITSPHSLTPGMIAEDLKKQYKELLGHDDEKVFHIASVAAAAPRGFSDFTMKATVGGIIVAGFILGIFFVSAVYFNKKGQTYNLLETDLEF